MYKCDIIVIYLPIEKNVFYQHFSKIPQDSTIANIRNKEKEQRSVEWTSIIGKCIKASRSKEQQCIGPGFVCI
jgi:hypothetical protein